MMACSFRVVILLYSLNDIYVGRKGKLHLITAGDSGRAVYKARFERHKSIPQNKWWGAIVNYMIKCEARLAVWQTCHSNVDE